MTFELSYIIAPVVGGVIGYITNDIAIRMLFRPHTAKYIFGMHVPFTPGIIPKEKSRLAAAIGDVISENLMNHEVLGKYLLADEMTSKLRGGIIRFFDKLKKEPRTIHDYLLRYLSEDEIDSIANDIKANLTKQVGDKLLHGDLGDKVSHIVTDHVFDKINHNSAKDFFDEIKELMGFGPLGNFLEEKLLSKLLEKLHSPVEKLLSKNINDMLQQHGEEITSKMIGSEADSFMNKPIRDLLVGRDSKIQQVAESIMSIYQTLVEKHLPHALSSLDISKIVTERVNEMDVNETEKLIFQVMDKELKAIVWLGALLGLIMGCINIFI